MNLDRLMPVLRTWDLPASIEFYQRVLGFELRGHLPERMWASLSYGSATVMLSGPNEHEGDQAPAFTGSLYFRVRNVDEVWARIKDQARVCYPVETFDYGMREFGIYDNNGYLLQFGEAVPEA